MAEKATLAYTMEHPCYAALRVEHELRLKAIRASADGNLGLWPRHVYSPPPILPTIQE